MRWLGRAAIGAAFLFALGRLVTPSDAVNDPELGEVTRPPAAASAPASGSGDSPATATPTPAAAPGSVASVGWPAPAYNPAPAADDLILPLPCGGAMTFRRVDTPTGANPLDDRPVLLGQPNGDSDYAEYLRRDAVAGPFEDPASHNRYYWLGKYEVTRDQYQSVTGSLCPSLSAAGRRPMVQVSWFDAVSFGHQYSLWLLKHADQALPARGHARAFVRLPTEAEWEYAARGGVAVSESAFREPLFPMPEGGPEQYAWFAGARSANGQLRPIGQLRPNPLGLHDMIGNAAELVLEPFRLNHAGRLHGQAGGVIAKGGDYETPEARLRTAQRVELPPYDDASDQANGLKTVGFRVALGLPALTDLSQAASLPEAFERLRQEQPPEPPASGPERVRQHVLGSMVEGAPASLRQRREQAQALAEAEQRAQAALKPLLANGVFLIKSLREADQRLEQLRKLQEELKGKRKPEPALDARLTDLRRLIDNERATFDATASRYAETVADLATWDEQTLAEPAKGAPAETALLLAQARDYRKDKVARRAEWLQALLK